MSDLDNTSDDATEVVDVMTDTEAPAEEAEETVATADAVADEAVSEDAPEADDAPAEEEEAPAEAEAAAEPAADEGEALVDVADEDELFEVEEAPRVESPYDRPGRWYVVHTQSGHEKKAQQNLAARTDSMNMGERIYESVIPMEDVVEFRNGKKVVVCLLYTSPSPRDLYTSRMPSSA